MIDWFTSWKLDWQLDELGGSWGTLNLRVRRVVELLLLWEDLFVLPMGLILTFLLNTRSAISDS